MRLLLLLKHGCVGLVDHASEDSEHELVGIQLGSLCTTTEERLMEMISWTFVTQSREHMLGIAHPTCWFKCWCWLSIEVRRLQAVLALVAHNDVDIASVGDLGDTRLLPAFRSGGMLMQEIPAGIELNLVQSADEGKVEAALAHVFLNLGWIHALIVEVLVE